ncbi:MAG: DNA repair exonuclease [Bacillota bacterium]|nr:DNA repair exonuclease [Bacillota bacterium]
MKEISFIHAADLHLDSPMIGLRNLPVSILKRLRESTFKALKKLTNAAIKKNVDFVILAGDLFDGEDRSLKAQSHLRTEMLKLMKHDIPVYIIHGNHDHLSGDWVHLEMPSNVHIFTDKVESMTLVTKKGMRVNLYGFSYPERHVYERKITHYQKSGNADYHIGILHGNEEGENEHGNYAPFVVKELLEKDFHYWALGHIHKRKVLSENPPIIYPGNIQGRNKKEKEIKGCYHVNLSDFETSLEFIETSDVIWEDVEIDLAGLRNFYEVLEKCQAIVKDCRKEKMGTLLTLSLLNHELEDDKERRALAAELIELLQENEQDEDAFVWVTEIIAEQNQIVSKENLKKESEFYSELLNTVAHYEYDEIPLSALYHHQMGRKYLSSLTSNEHVQLLEKAEILLLNLLYKS